MFMYCAITYKFPVCEKMNSGTTCIMEKAISKLSESQYTATKPRNEMKLGRYISCACINKCGKEFLAW